MMSKLNAFWESFQKQEFKQAQVKFDKLDDETKQALFAELFQKSGYHQKPLMISILERKLHDNMKFDDFYQAWLPSEDMSNQAESRGQIFQQHFPLPVRVINATNINNPKEILSIGITWVTNKEEEKSVWEYVKKADDGEVENNEIRHDRIEKVADGKLLGLFRVETDDNLGTPF